MCIRDSHGTTGSTNRGTKAWDWELSRPNRPFSIFEYIFHGDYDYRRYWTGTYVGDEIDYNVAVPAQQMHEWLCLKNAWCGADGGRGGDHRTFHVVGNWDGQNQSQGLFTSKNMTVWVDPSPGNSDIIAHEMTHVKFYNALGDTRGEARYAAVNEGMADAGAFCSPTATRSSRGGICAIPRPRTSAT